MSERIFRWRNNRSLPGVFVGVMLQHLDGGWTHAGLIYRTQTTSSAYVLHLWSNGKLKHDPPTSKQVCVLPNIEAVRLPAIAAFARRVYRKNVPHRIQYGFSSPDRDWFNAEGQIILGADRLGLTCSNFVLAIFRAAGFPLVKLETWPPRAEDKEWQAHVIELLTDNADGDRRKLSRLEKVKTEIGVVRCRPVEMGGAALSDQIPCAFPEALELANQVEPLLG